MAAARWSTAFIRDVKVTRSALSVIPQMGYKKGLRRRGWTEIRSARQEMMPS